MGCASSKQSKCRHCKTTKYSPMSRRSYSMNVHHPPEKQGDSYHMVALTSSTLGSIRLEKPVDISFSAGAENWDDHQIEREEVDVRKNHQVGIEKNIEFTMDMIEAKAWSKMIDEKITRVAPKTPIRTPPGEPETINVKELMEGLEDNNNTSPLRLFGEKHVRSFSFHVSVDSIPPLIDSPRTGGGFEEDRLDSPKNNTKAWFDAQVKDDNVNSISKALVSEFDPEVISMFRKALEELSPTNPFHLKARDGVREQHQVIKDDSGVLQVNNKSNNGEDKMMNGYLNEEKLLNGFVVDDDDDDDGYGYAHAHAHAHVNGFVDRIIADEKDDSAEEKDDVTSLTDYGCDDQSNEFEVVINPSGERVILYFTSLRGVRGTYENCCYVRLILKGLGVRVDERDVSMHSGFKEELKELLGEGFKGGLPKVFIGERYIGGIEEIRKMHEDGKLEKLVAHCERLGDDGGNLVDVCEACGDIRFVLCETCSGSCKIYYEHEEGDDEYAEDEYGFQRCPDCNENGLIRCPICCY